MLFLMPLYLFFVLIFIFIFIRRYKGMKKFYAFFIWSFILYLPVGWDVILGRSYHFYLCNTDAGVNIYKTVVLGPEYWHEDGSPKFYDEEGGLNEDKLHANHIVKRYVSENLNKLVLNEKRHSYQIVDRESDKVLGELISYSYLGGWVFNISKPFGPAAITCPNYSDLKVNPSMNSSQYNHTQPTHYTKFTSYIFLK